MKRLVRARWEEDGHSAACPLAAPADARESNLGKHRAAWPQTLTCPDLVSVAFGPLFVKTPENRPKIAVY